MTLQDYLTEAYPGVAISRADALFAARINSTRQTVARYRQFKRYPSPEVVARIRDTTRGLVTPEDHLPEHLRAQQQVS